MHFPPPVPFVANGVHPIHAGLTPTFRGPRFYRSCPPLFSFFGIKYVQTASNDIYKYVWKKQQQRNFYNQQDQLACIFDSEHRYVTSYAPKYKQPTNKRQIFACLCMPLLVRLPAATTMSAVARFIVACRACVQCTVIGPHTPHMLHQRQNKFKFLQQ